MVPRFSLARTAAAVGLALVLMPACHLDDRPTATPYLPGTAELDDGASDAGAPSPAASSTPSAAVTPAPVPVPVPVPPPLRILFIGNSYTYVNDVPGLLTRIASSAGMGPEIVTDQVVQGGATLEQHWNDGVAKARIGQGGWTHVVLQGQSYEPAAGDNSSFMSNAKRFGDLATNAGARPTWFVTWARAKEAFPASVADVQVARMQDELTFAYAESMRQVPGSLLGCVGEAFRSSLRNHPELVLHESDSSHATIAGSYLAAATFYVALTGSPVPLGSALPNGLSKDAAAILRNEALVGSSCADVRVRGDVTLYEGSAGWRDAAGNPTSSTMGTRGTPSTRQLYLGNQGKTIAGITDGLTLAPPFAWTTGVYPGGVGVDPILGQPYCSSTLAPGATCALSLSYSGTSTRAGAMTLNLTDAYQSRIVQALTTTDRAILSIRPPVNTATVMATVGDSKEFQLLVSNDGVQPAFAIAPGLHPSAPFGWGGGGSFPGGAGPTQVDGATYDHCTTFLAAGHTCAITLRFAPVTTPPTQCLSTFGLEFWSKPSTWEAATRDVVYTPLFAIANAAP